MRRPQPEGLAASSMFGVDTPFATTGEIYEEGRARLDPPVRDFLESGAGADVTVRANREAFEGWGLRPRAMSGIRVPDPSTEVLGIRLSMPLLVAPFGGDALFHPDGHLAAGRAAEHAGVASIVPQAGSFSIEDVSAAAPRAARMLQIYPVGDPRHVAALVARAAAAGCTTVVITVDSPTGGWRERNLRNRFHPDISLFSGHYPPDSGVAPETVFGQLFRIDEPVWSWAALAEVMGDAPLPWVAKGVLDRADAEAAVDAGAAGIVVSNHGGRQLDGAPATLRQLPEVVRAVGGEVPVLLDGGARSGTDILKALALGARAALLGRPVALALAAGGEQAVRRLFELLSDELVTLLTLVGRSRVADVDETIVYRRDGR